MAQIFDRSSNALARMSLVLTGLIVIALGVTLDQLQRSPWVTRQGQRAGPAGSFQPQASRAGSWPSMPVLPHHGGEIQLRGHSSDQDLHELPRADLDQRALLEPVRAQLGHGRVDPLDQGSRPSRLCLLQPRNSREQGHRLRQLSRPRRPDAADVQAEHAADGVVPELPSQSRRRICGPPARSTTWPGKAPQDKPVWCASDGEKTGAPTAQTVNCTTMNPEQVGVAQLARHAAADRFSRRRTCWTWRRIRHGAQARLCADNVSYYRNSPARISWATSC